MSRSAASALSVRSPDLASESEDYPLEELDRGWEDYDSEADLDGESVDTPPAPSAVAARQSRFHDIHWNESDLQPPIISLDEELVVPDLAMEQMFPSADSTTPLTFGLRRSRAKRGRLNLTADTVAEGGDLQRFKTKYAAYLTGTPPPQTIQDRMARQAKGARPASHGQARPARQAQRDQNERDSQPRLRQGTSPTRPRIDNIETLPEIQMRATSRGKRKYYPIVRADAFIKKGQHLGPLAGVLLTLDLAEEAYEEGADPSRMVEVKKAGDPQAYVIDGSEVLHWAWFMQDATEHNVMPNVRMTRGGYLKAAMDIPGNTPLYIEWTKFLLMMEDDAPDMEGFIEDDVDDDNAISDDQGAETDDDNDAADDDNDAADNDDDDDDDDVFAEVEDDNDEAEDDNDEAEDDEDVGTHHGASLALTEQDVQPLSPQGNERPSDIVHLDLDAVNDQLFSNNVLGDDRDDGAAFEAVLRDTMDFSPKW